MSIISASFDNVLPSYFPSDDGAAATSFLGFGAATRDAVTPEFTAQIDFAHDYNTPATTLSLSGHASWETLQPEFSNKFNGFDVLKAISPAGADDAPLFAASTVARFVPPQFKAVALGATLLSASWNSLRQATPQWGHSSGGMPTFSGGVFSTGGSSIASEDFSSDTTFAPVDTSSNANSGRPAFNWLGLSNTANTNATSGGHWWNSVQGMFNEWSEDGIVGPKPESETNDVLNQDGVTSFNPRMADRRQTWNPAELTGPEQAVYEEQLTDVVDQAFGRVQQRLLDKNARELVVGKYVSDTPVKELAAELGTNPSSARRTLDEASRQVRANPDIRAVADELNVKGWFPQLKEFILSRYKP